MFEKDASGVVTSKQIFDVYKSWARANGINALSERRLYNWIGANAEKLKIAKAQIGEKRLKGYQGYKIRKEWSQGIVL